MIGLSSRGDRGDVERIRREFGISFPLIPAPVRQVAETYGVWNHQKNTAFGTVIIDKAGVVRYLRFGQDEYDRPSTLEIISSLTSIK